MTDPIPLDPLSEKSEAKRLWIGNLDPKITEFVLLKLLQQHGSIEKFDLLIYRSGPLQGCSKGYAFVSYSDPELAKTAMEKLNGKKLGRKALCVKWAHNMKEDDVFIKDKKVPIIPALAGGKGLEKLSKKSVIKAIETKLKNMEAANSLEFEINRKPVSEFTRSSHSTADKSTCTKLVKFKSEPSNCKRKF